MFASDILDLIIFLDSMPKEFHEKVIIVMQVILIIAEIIAFFYIKHSYKQY